MMIPWERNRTAPDWKSGDAERSFPRCFRSREEGEPITSPPLSSLMLEGECEWMLPEATSDRSPITCPASLQLLSIEALSMPVPVPRATTFLPAVSCDTLMDARDASTVLCRRLRASTFAHCGSSAALQIPLVGRA